MKVLQIFNRYLNFGGEENSVNRIADQLQSCGAEVERFIRSASEWKGEGSPPMWKQAFLLSNNTDILEELRAHHARFNPDVWLLHNILPVVSLGIYRLAKELGVPVIQWLHNYRPISLSGSLRLRNEQLTTTNSFIHLREILEGTWRGRVASAILAVSYLRARLGGWLDHVSAWVAVSETMKNSFETAGFYPEKLHHLHHSWEIQPKLEGQMKAGTFLYLGRLLPEKGVDFLLKVFQDPRLSGCKLVIAGDGPLKEKIETVDLPNVEFVGWVSGEEKKALILRSSAVLFPSLWEEPLSTIAYEAYEQERALVTSNRGGMVEIVNDGVTGNILKGDDLEEWVNCLERLSDSPDQLLQMGQGGRLWLQENVSAKIWHQGFMEIAKKVIDD